MPSFSRRIPRPRATVVSNVNQPSVTPTAAVASLYAYINPLVAMITATILLNEKLTMNIVWGSVVTLVGVFPVNYSIKKTREKAIVEAEL